MNRDSNRYVQLTDSGLARLHNARRRLGLTMEELINDPTTPSANTVKKALRKEPVFVRTLEKIGLYLQRQAAERKITFPLLTEGEDYYFKEGEAPEASPSEPRVGWLSRQVPHPNRLFTGRRDVLERLRAAFLATTPVSDPQAIIGMGGMGKTQTALAYAYTYRNAYRHVFWVNAASLADLNDGLAGLAKELRPPDSPVMSNQKQALDWVHQWFRDASEWLLVLDNADELATLAPHFPRHHGGHLLLTTRTPNTARWAAPISLSKFDSDEGAQLLLRRAGRLGIHESLSAAAPELVQDARALSQELDGLPLAINQAGAYLAESTHSIAEYHLEYQRRGLSLLDHSPDPDHLSVTITFQLALEQMRGRAIFGDAAVELVSLCAFLVPDAIPEKVLATYCGEKVDDVYAAFLTYSLATRNPENQTLTIHRLVQRAAQEALSPEQQKQWRQRAVEAIANTTPDFEYEDWPLCEQLLPHWRLCASHIQEDQIQTERAAYLLYQAGRYLRARAAYEEAGPFLRTAVALSERVHGPVHATTADLLDELACLYREQDRGAEAEALFLRALAITEALEGAAHPHTAGKLHNMALFYAQKQDFPRAEALFVRALAIWELHPDQDPNFMAATLTQLAGVYRFQELYARAEPYSRRALALYEHTLPARHIHVATACHNLGLLCVNLERYSEAEILFARALEINEQARGKDHPETASVLWGLAWCRWMQGNYPETDHLFRRALEIYTRSYGQDHSQVTRLANSYARFQKETGFALTDPPK